MREAIDSALSYTLAIFIILFAGIVQYADIILQLGGLVLLLLRLYVDGVRAYKTMKGIG